MAGKVNPIPAGYHTATPYLTLSNCARAIDFYKKLNATFCDEWKVVCLEGTALQTLAKEAQ